LKFLTRGLFALIFISFFQTQLFAKYLYKDEVIHNPKFTQEVEALGAELYEKTGISLKLIMLRELPKGKSILEYEREVLKNFNEPTIVLTFSEMDQKVDLLVNDTSLYKYFDKKQVLSPVASAVQAFLMAVVYADSWESFNEMRKDYGGSILPLIAGKAKKGQVLGKYSGSMYNGYLDIAEQIAQSKGVILEHGAGNSNKNTIFIIKLFFYGFVIYGIVMYVRRKLYIRRQNREQK
jgi:hypothetical protein